MFSFGDNIGFEHLEFLAVALVVACAAFVYGIVRAYRERRAFTGKRFSVSWKIFARWIFGVPCMLGMLFLALSQMIYFSDDILSEDLSGRLMLPIDNSPSMGAGIGGDMMSQASCEN